MSPGQEGDGLPVHSSNLERDSDDLKRSANHDDRQSDGFP